MPFSTEPIHAGGFTWHVEPAPCAVNRGLRASTGSVSVHVTRDDEEDMLVVEFSKSGIQEFQFPSDIWLAALDAARELIGRVTAVRGVTGAP